MRTKTNLFLMALLLSFTAHATRVENKAALGLNIDTVKSDLPNNYDISNEIGIAPTFGWLHLRRWDNVSFRTGVLAEWKHLDVKDKNATSGQTNLQLRSYYAAIPVNLQFDVTNKWAVFAGVTPRILIAQTCEHCGNLDKDNKILNNYYNIGVTYMFGRKFGVDGIFHYAADELYEDIKINTAQVLLHYEF